MDRDREMKDDRRDDDRDTAANGDDRKGMTDLDTAMVDTINGTIG